MSSSDIIRLDFGNRMNAPNESKGDNVECIRDKERYIYMTDIVMNPI
jgi:hypothetical protein